MPTFLMKKNTPVLKKEVCFNSYLIVFLKGPNFLREDGDGSAVRSPNMGISVPRIDIHSITVSLFVSKRSSKIHQTAFLKIKI